MTTVAPELTRSLCASLTLSERRSALLKRHTNGSAQEIDDVRARDALHRWKSQPPFTIGDHFEKRLNTAGLTEEELLTILGLPATEYSEFLQIPPQWLQDLDRLYATYGPAEGDPQSRQWAQQATNGFLIIAEPLIEEALRRIRHIHQPQVRLINQRVGLQGLARALIAHLAPGHAAQIALNYGRKPQRPRISGAPNPQELGYLYRFRQSPSLRPNKVYYAVSALGGLLPPAPAEVGTQ